MQLAMIRKVCASVMLGAGVIFAAEAQVNWVYDAGAKTMTDGNWTLAVTSWDGAGKLKIGSPTGDPVEGAGALDLWDATVDGVAVTELRFSTSFSKGQGGGDYCTNILEFAANHIAAIETLIFTDSTSIQKLILGSETLEEIGNNVTWRAYNLKHLEIKMPKLVKVGQNFTSETYPTNEVADAIPSQLRYLGNGAYGARSTKVKKFVGTLVLTNNLTYLGAGFSYFGVTNAILKGTADIKTLPNSMFYQCGTLKNVELDFPGLETIDIQQFNGAGLAAQSVEANKVIPKGVKWIHGGYHAWNFLKGTLELTNFCGFVYNRTGGTAGLQDCGVTNLVLSGPVEELPSGCLSKAKIETLTLNCPNLTNVVTSAFNGNLKEITFMGAPLGTEVIDGIVANVGAVAETVDKTKPLKFFVKRSLGWDAAAYCSAVTGEYEAEWRKALSEKSRCFGVYREGLRKAWLIDLGAKGLCIRIQ